MIQDSDLDSFLRSDAGSDEPAAAPKTGSAPPSAGSFTFNLKSITPEISQAFKIAADAYGVDENVLIGIAARESGFNPQAVGPVTKNGKRAVGLMQFMPDTAKEYGIDPTDPIESVMGTAAYMRQSLDRFGGDYRKAIASYNWGRNRSEFDAPDWDKSLPKETSQYLAYVEQFIGVESDRNPKQELPAGVKPSEAGAGRGFVNPPMADEADLNKPFIGFQGPTGGKVKPREEAPAMGGELGRLRDTFFSGVDSAKAGVEAVNVSAQAVQLQKANERLSQLEASGQGQTPEAQGLRKTVEAYAKRFPMMIRSAAESQAQAQRGGQMVASPVVDAIGKAKTFGEAWDLFTTAPYEVISTVTAQSIPAMLPGLIAAAIAGPGAGALIMGASSGLNEAGSSLADFAKDHGVNLADEAQAKAFFSDPKNLSEALSYAGTRAGIIGAMDAVSGGVAGKTLAPVMRNKLARQAVNIPAQTVAQASAGAGGDALAQIATKGSVDEPGKVFLEAVGELGGAPLEVAAFSKDARDALTQPRKPIEAKIADISKAETIDEVAAKALEVVNTPVAPATPDGGAADNLSDLIQSKIIAPDLAPTVDAITALENTNVSPSGDSGVVAAGAPASQADQSGPGVGAAGLAVPDTRGSGSVDTAAADSSVPASGTVPQPGGESSPAVEPAKVWYGRRGDGYLTPEDAQRGLGERQRLQGQFDWRIEPTPDGKYRLAGYAPSTATGTVQASAPAYQAVNQSPITFRQGKGGSWFVGGDPATIRDLLRANGITNFLPTKDGAQLPANTDPEVIGAIRMMAEDFKNLSIQELKNEIRQRMGMTQPPKEPKQTRSFRDFLRSVGIRSDIAGDVVGESNRMRANQILPMTFRRNGLNLDALAERALEMGFLTQQDIDNPNDNGGVNRLVEMIKAESRGVRQAPIDEQTSVDAEQAQAEKELITGLDKLGVPASSYADLSVPQMNSMLNRIERRLRDARLRKQQLDVAEESRLEREAIQMADQITLADVSALERRSEMREASLEQFMRALLFTEQEIQDELAKQANQAQSDQAPAGDAATGPQGSAEADAGNTDRASQAGPAGEVDLFGAAPNASQQEANRIRQEREDRERAQQQSAPSPDEFDLSGSDRAADVGAARGQGDLLAPTEKENPASLSTSDGRGKETGESEQVAATSATKDAQQAEVPALAGIRGLDQQGAASERARKAREAGTSWAVGIPGKLPEYEAPTRASAEAFITPSMRKLGFVAYPMAQAAPSEPMQEGKAEPSPKAKIDDFGEKLTGARKDYAATLKDAEGVDVATEPLSKSWPEPDYDKLLAGGADPFVVAFVHAARDEIPTKPQKSWKLKGWVESVQALRDMATRLLDGSISRDKLEDRLSRPAFDVLRRNVGSRSELYQLIGHGKSLKGITFAKNHYSLYKGQENVTKWVVEQKAKATAFSNWPRELAVGDTKEEMLENFKAKFASMDTSPSAKGQAQFVIYRKRNEPGVAFVGKKIGREYIDLHKAESVSAARKYLQENTAELEKTLEAYKTTPLERKPDNQPRVGDDHRNGAPVTPAIFAETFGFRGVQFGNYVEQGRRQSDLNEAYDGLMDMAAVLGIPPKALSLNGKLGLAFGARGKGGRGAPAAHYEPGTIVINLTKGGGPGSLAHEWWHALDNYFGNESGAGGYGTGTVLGDKMRAEMRAAFEAVKTATQAKTLRRRAQELDKRKSKPYWDTPIELSARSFESYIIAKLEDQGAANDYLANVVDKAFWDAQEALRAGLLSEAKQPETFPYPIADEMPAVRAAFDDFFKTVQTREDDAGNVAMFSRGAFYSSLRQSIEKINATGGMSVEAARKIIDAKVAKWTNGPRVVVVATPQDLPMQAPDDANGVYHQGTVYIVAGAHRSPGQVLRTLAHEAVAHYGLRGMLGDGYKKFLAQMQMAIKMGNKPLIAIRDDVRSRYDGLTELQEADEIAARAIEMGLDENGEFKTGFGWLKSWFAKLAQFLRTELGILIPVSNLELQGMLVNAQRFVRGRPDGTGVAVEPAPAFAKGGTKQGVPTFDNASGNYNPDLDPFWIKQAVKDIKGDGMPDAEYHTAIAEYANARRVESLLEQLGWKRRGSSNISASTYFTKDIGRGEFDTEYKTFDEYETHEVRISDHDDYHPASDDIKSRTQVNFRQSDATPWADVDITPDMSNADALDALKAALPNDPTAPESGGANDDIAFSRGQPGLFDSGQWDVPETGRVDAIIQKLQDGRIDLKRAQDAIIESGKTIDEKFDARLAETLYAGRVAHRSENFIKGEVKELLERMARLNVPMTDLSDFLLARHAPERNKQIAKVNPDMPDGGAGSNSKGELMTTQAAKDYIAALPSETKLKMTTLAALVDKITKGTRELLVAEGLESRDSIQAWEGAYSNYVPLFKDEAQGVSHPIGQGMSVRGSASRRATGSTGEVTNMLAHVLMQREAAITRAEKNRVGLALYGLALSHPNKDFWTTIKPNMSEEAISEELEAMGVDLNEASQGMSFAPTIRDVDSKTGQVVSRPNPLYKNLPGAMVVRVNGEDRVLMFNQENERGLRLAQNLKNLDGLDIANETLQKIVGTPTRWIASVNTQYNPAFGLVNVTRDALGAMVNLSSTQIAGKQFQVAGHVPSAMAGIFQHMRGDMDGEWAKLYEQFQMDGGKTGFKEMFRTADERTKALQDAIDKVDRSKLDPREIASGLLSILDGFNTISENIVRLSAYKVALDSGLSRAESARLARELTVDFNRKGSHGTTMGMLYAFFNASVQGSARTIKAIQGPAGKSIILGGLALGAMQALMLAAAGYDDDEIPEWVKARGLVIPLGKDDQGQKKHAIIPLPLGLHVLPNTGRVLTELALYGKRDMGTKIVNAVGEIAGAFNPMGGANILTDEGALKTILPTIFDPLAELATNTNFSGRKIEKDYRETDNRPGFQRAREGTIRTASGQAYISVSKAMNTLTGGTDYQRGLASPSPEQIRYVAQVVGGGLLREVEKVANMAMPTASQRDIKVTGIPLAGRFYGVADDEQTQSSRYYKNAKDIDKIESSLGAAKKAGDREAVAEMSKDPLAALVHYNNTVGARLSKLNKMAVQTVNDRARTIQIDRDRTELMRSLNNEVIRMEEKADGPNLAQRMRR